MITLIDNYDSFTWNLVHLIGGLGYEVKVFRNDAITPAGVIEARPHAVILSPGPCTPDEAGICLDLSRLCIERNIPIFGVCLGLQSMAQALGGKIVRANKMMHGKVSEVTHTKTSFLKPLPQTFTATRYHSLVVAPDSLPNSLTPVAFSDDDGEIMAIEHKSAPMAAVQFHPESIASQQGATLIKAFMEWAEPRRSPPLAHHTL